MNLRRTMYKLQTALCQNGRRVKINQFQVWSEKSERMVTKFVITEKRETPEGQKKDYNLFESYQIADVVKFLAGLYGGDGG